MSENDTETQKSMAERWFEEQQAWQRTMRDYADSMAKDEAFLTHLGNAMRGSLLAGTAYPTPAAPGTPGVDVPKAPIDDKLDQVLFTLKAIDGRLRDLEDALSELGATAQPASGEEVAAPSAPLDVPPADPAESTAPAATAKRATTARATSTRSRASASGGDTSAPKRATKPRSTAKPAPKAARRSTDAEG